MPIVAALAAVTSAGACFLWKPPAPTEPPLEVTITIPVDSVAIQLRDSATTLTAGAIGKLGVNLDSAIVWSSTDSSIVTVMQVGPVATLIPKRAGLTAIEARVSTTVATVAVQVFDTVYSVQVTPADTIQSLGAPLNYAATVLGPAGASTKVVWSVLDSTKARIDSSSNPVKIISIDTGNTTVVATSAIDRNRKATVPLRTAPPAGLYFASEPSQSAIIAHAGDPFSPGITVGVRDTRGIAIPFTLPVTLSLAPGTGSPGAVVLGQVVQPADSGMAVFEGIRLDRSGSAFQFVASAPGLTSATSEPFAVKAECAGTPYAIGNDASGTLSTSSCQLQSGEYYARFTMTNTNQQFFSVTMTSAATLRVGFVFTDSTWYVDAGKVLSAVLVPPGTARVLVVSSTAGATDAFQLTTQANPSLLECSYGLGGAGGCTNIQIQRGVTFTDAMRGDNGPVSRCSGAHTIQNSYRLHLPPNAAATMTAASAAFDPCLQGPGFDDNSGGGTTARLAIPASKAYRNYVIYLTPNAQVAKGAMATVSVQP